MFPKVSGEGGDLGQRRSGHPDSGSPPPPPALHLRGGPHSNTSFYLDAHDHQLAYVTYFQKEDMEGTE